VDVAVDVAVDVEGGANYSGTLRKEGGVSWAYQPWPCDLAAEG
jgi:hypothetical protein